MSIKRSRDYSRRPTPDYKEPSAAPKRAQRKYSFDRDVASRPAESAVAYGPAYRFAENDLIEHTVFGRGLVTRVDGIRIEVLFKEGLKKLAHDPGGPTPAKATPSEQPLTPSEAAPPAGERQAATTDGAATEEKDSTGSEPSDR